MKRREDSTLATLIEFPSESGGVIVIEVHPEWDTVESGRVPASTARDVVQRAHDTLEAALAKIRQIANAVISQCQSINADEITLEFGIKLHTQFGVVVAGTQQEANFHVKLTWKRDQS